MWGGPQGASANRGLHAQVPSQFPVTPCFDQNRHGCDMAADAEQSSGTAIPAQVDSLTAD